MKKNKGFTLIELLAVIVILAVLVLLAVPSVTKVLKNSQRQTFIVQANAIVDNAKMAYEDALIGNTELKTCYNLTELRTYNTKSYNYGAVGSVLIDDATGTYRVWYYDGAIYYVEGAYYGKIDNGEVVNQVNEGAPSSTSTYSTCGS